MHRFKDFHINIDVFPKKVASIKPFSNPLIYTPEYMAVPGHLLVLQHTRN